MFREPTLGPAPGRFPAAHHDVIDVATALRVEGGVPIDIGGASAGANLAAGAVLAMRDDRVPMPRSVVLAYGALHSRTPENVEIESSLRGPLARWFFNPAMTRRMTLNYVGAAEGLAHPYVFPGGADLRGFPPALVLDASNDRLRRSGHAFADELRRAGSRVEEVVVRARHGFLNSPRRTPFAAGMTTIVDFIGRLGSGSPDADAR